MKGNLLQHLRCTTCQGNLAWHAYSNHNKDEIKDGIAWCESCKNWYPIEDSLLELLPPNLAYHDDRKRFFEKYRADMENRGLIVAADQEKDSSVEMQLKQQEHFDWYSQNENQSYNDYEHLPFWEAVDLVTFADWRKRVKPNTWMLDIGCAQGRSAFKFMDMPINIVGFDISKPAIRQAIQRYRAGQYKADAIFFCADGSNLPFTPNTFDYVLIYGVLHHLPDPGHTCKQIADILKPNGIYFGSENNETILRTLFDLLMKIKPLWFEEAGAEPLISAKQFREWFANTSVNIKTNTHVFLPPHLINLLGHRLGLQFLRFSDALGRVLPFLRKHGGLIQCYGTKQIK
ncbi:MAG: methyltransferase domain-containing protein [Gammaproteobacteria bacterium]